MVNISLRVVAERPFDHHYRIAVFDLKKCCPDPSLYLWVARMGAGTEAVVDHLKDRGLTSGYLTCDDADRSHTAISLKKTDVVRAAHASEP